MGLRIRQASIFGTLAVTGLTLVVLMLLSISLDAVAVTDRYIAVKNAEDKQAKNLIKPISKQMLALFDEQLPMKQALTIIYGAEDGPLFDPDSSQILIPYEFVTEVYARFHHDNYQETGVSPEDATRDVLMHTLAHEYGHAYIFSNQVIVLGKEEDAVDTLATLMLIHSFDNGADIALSAADLFSLEDEDIKELDDDHFWDEHSLDAQRYFSTLCLIYGSNPEKYGKVISKAQLEIERDSYCEEEYFRQTENWDRLKERYSVLPSKVK
ncbi:hypothetical protein FM037_27860 [Shewanella psychropiezotolerans]|uniref:Metallopeptidase DUF4344 n=1 Tax=Shewanella psychropiezotolerans TaxID=2593655 RepID=A0ABX5X4W0_9GAMM|nr:DUF4344 domain-containing metallopeptidase [Shewanella psychropiezotolerans]QDO86390.1 hypothetical protein FM037_27860 [Shewanella psychropiezotolerans]